MSLNKNKALKAHMAEGAGNRGPGTANWLKSIEEGGLPLYSRWRTVDGVVREAIFIIWGVRNIAVSGVWGIYLSYGCWWPVFGKLVVKSGLHHFSWFLNAPRSPPQIPDELSWPWGPDSSLDSVSSAECLLGILAA